MKKHTFRTLLLSATAVGALFAVGTGKASAIDIGIRVGGPPPGPVVVEHPWHRPYTGAVWIPAQYEWRHDQWVLVHGYYAYPPYPHAVWVPAHYSHGYWHQGHWRHA
jgi:hypothetical protein